MNYSPRLKRILKNPTSQVLLLVSLAIFLFGLTEWRPAFEVPPEPDLASVRGVLSKHYERKGIGPKYVVTDRSGKQHVFDCGRRGDVFCMESEEAHSALGQVVEAKFAPLHPTWLIKISTIDDNREIYSYSLSKEYYAENTAQIVFPVASLFFFIVFLIHAIISKRDYK
ncbi:hypothetical protein [Burkholderia ubonensis]|uniref:hypothetical protein n=1 Tax=Burkholderia ubonensis TaxID=101571 RepID=UPI0012FBE1E1|nr:hypothetical protein [Burkholderia ubonensis]